MSHYGWGTRHTGGIDWFINQCKAGKRDPKIAMQELMDDPDAVISEVCNTLRAPNKNQYQEIKQFIYNLKIFNIVLSEKTSQPKSPPTTNSSGFQCCVQ